MSVIIQVGDCRDLLKAMPAQSVHCCVTSPPYFGLRDYGMAAQIGLEQTPDAFVAELVEVFREVRRVLRDDGTLWLNLGDSYAGAGYSNHKGTGGTQREDGGKQRHLSDTGCKNKDLIGIPWRVAFALQADGWYLRQDIIWHKPNPMPESVKDRCTKAHEYIFLLSKSDRYYFDNKSIMEPAIYGEQHANKTTSWGTNRKHPNKSNLKNYQIKGDNKTTHRADDGSYVKNKRSVWTVTTKPFKGAHFATFPPNLIEPCILAGAPVGGTILDPFGGAGTTGLVASQHGRNAILCELNPEYAEIARCRLAELDGFVCGKPNTIEGVINYTQFVARAALGEKE